MTREEAIASYENKLYAYMVGDDDAIDMDFGEFMELNHYIRTALRPVSREQVEKVWRGEWITPTIIGGRAYNIPHCSACNGVPCGTDEHTRFCAHCGAPMTDEAVQTVIKRLEELKNGKGD